MMTTFIVTTIVAVLLLLQLHTAFINAQFNEQDFNDNNDSAFTSSFNDWSSDQANANNAYADEVEDTVNSDLNSIDEQDSESVEASIDSASINEAVASISAAEESRQVDSDAVVLRKLQLEAELTRRVVTKLMRHPELLRPDVRAALQQHFKSFLANQHRQEDTIKRHRQRLLNHLNLIHVGA